jgi:hypothetical protein
VHTHTNDNAHVKLKFLTRELTKEEGECIVDAYDDYQHGDTKVQGHKEAILQKVCCTVLVWHANNVWCHTDRF